MYVIWYGVSYAQDSLQVYKNKHALYFGMGSNWFYDFGYSYITQNSILSVYRQSMQVTDEFEAFQKRLKGLPVATYNVTYGYKHNWSDNFYSTISAGLCYMDREEYDGISVPINVQTIYNFRRFLIGTKIGAMGIHTGDFYASAFLGYNVDFTDPFGIKSDASKPKQPEYFKGTRYIKPKPSEHRLGVLCGFSIFNIGGAGILYLQVNYSYNEHLLIFDLGVFGFSGYQLSYGLQKKINNLYVYASVGGGVIHYYNKEYFMVSTAKVGLRYNLFNFISFNLGVDAYYIPSNTGAKRFRAEQFSLSFPIGFGLNLEL